MKRLLLMIGTRKGAFLAFSTPDRRSWELQGPLLKGVQVHHVTRLTGTSPVLAVACKSDWFGPDVRMSRDFGETWLEPTRTVRFPEDRGLSVERVWVLSEDRRHETPVLYAGVDPGALFRSHDEGVSWSEVRALTEHPTRDRWQPGGGGMMVHSICHDPADKRRTYVGVSAAGVFRTDDGGENWEPKNSGVRADFLPDTLPPVGQCVHHLVMHPSKPDVLYQQNHCGVYRSENRGDDWIDISHGLPSRFGFPFAVHPHDGDTIYVAPAESDQSRMSAGAWRVFRSRNRGADWVALGNGLPQANAYQNVLRMAMTTDTLDPAGVYVGTQGGQLVASRDEGDHWEVLFNWLPPIFSVETAIIE